MAEYKLFFKRSAVKELKALSGRDLSAVLRRIEGLRINPRPQGCEKLSNREQYRIRQGNLRIIYSIEDDVLTVWIVKIGHRRDVYR